jgi:type IV pilus assembly protein PilB
MMDENDPYDLSKLGVNSRDIYAAKVKEMGVPFVDLTVFMPDPSVFDLVPAHVAERYNVIPLRREGNTLYVAMADINDEQAADEIRLVSRCQVRRILAAPDAIRVAIQRFYSGTLAE